MKIKVCHITSVHKQDDSRILYKECRSLAAAGFDTTLLVINGHDEVIDGVKIISVYFPKSGRVKRILKSGKVLLQKAIDLKADIYHLHDPELLRIAVQLKKATGSKVVFDSHEDLPKQIMDKHWIPSGIRGMVSGMAHRYEMKIASKIDAVVSVTETICKRFMLANKHVALVANYPILEEMTLPVDSQIKKVENQVCYIGGLFPTRGIKEIVLALEKTNAQLLLAGKFSTPQFEEEVKQLKGWEKVTFLGHVDRVKIVEILSSSILGIVTLHPTRSYVESLPIKLFEYMSAGLPVIASNFEMWEPLVLGNNCGVVVDPLDPDKIAEKINYLLDNPEIAKQMGENGFKAVHEKYSWEVEEKKLIHLYKQLIF